MPLSMSSTTLSGALMTFFICSLLSERGLDRFLRPLLGTGDGLFPPAVEPLALLLVHLRLVAAPETPPVLELFLIAPEPYGEAGQVSGTQRRSLQSLGHLGRGPQDVGLELHHPAVGGGPAVGLEGGDVYARVSLHSLDGVAGLVAHALQCRPGQVSPGRATRQPDDGAPRIRVPVRRAQPDEPRHEIHVVVGVEAGGQLLGLFRALDDAQSVPEPLHGGAGNEDGAFQRVLYRLVAEAPGYGGEHLALTLYGFCARVHEGEGSGAVSVLGEASVEGYLSEEGGLLVAGHAGYGNFRPEHVGVGVAVDVGARLHFG